MSVPRRKIEGVARADPPLCALTDLALFAVLTVSLFQISSVTAHKRVGVLELLLNRQDLHHRLINGTDYPSASLSHTRTLTHSHNSSERVLMMRLRAHVPFCFCFRVCCPSLSVPAVYIVVWTSQLRSANDSEMLLPRALLLLSQHAVAKARPLRAHFLSSSLLARPFDASLLSHCICVAVVFSRVAQRRLRDGRGRVTTRDLLGVPPRPGSLAHSHGRSNRSTTEPRPSTSEVNGSSTASTRRPSRHSL